MAAKKASPKKAAPKKEATGEAAVATFLAGVDEPRRTELAALDALVRAHAPGFSPYVASGMLCYGRYEYRYESGREGVAARVAIAPRAKTISVYVAAVDDKGWLAEQAAATLGKVSVGKSCIGMKRLEDLDRPAFAALLRRAAGLRGPGEV